MTPRARTAARRAWTATWAVFAVAGLTAFTALALWQLAVQR